MKTEEDLDAPITGMKRIAQAIDRTERAGYQLWETGKLSPAVVMFGGRLTTTRRRLNSLMFGGHADEQQ